MSRLDSLPTETLNKLLEMSGQTILPTSVISPKDGDVLVYDGTAKTWKNGTGGGGGVLVVNVTASEVGGEAVYTCDKTAGEMMAAMEAGGVVLKSTGAEGVYCDIVNTAAVMASGAYIFSSGSQYTADSATDYPTAGSTPK